MSVGQWLFIIGVTYASLSLGVLIKFVLNGLKGAPLWFAPFVPFLVFVVPIIVLVVLDSKEAIEEFGEKSAWQKLKVIRITFILTLSSLPFLSGLVSEAIRIVISKKRKSEFVHDAMPYVRNLYHEAMA